MNRLIPRIGAAIVTVSVFLFAVCMIVRFPFGSYLVCMFLPIGYILTAAGFYEETEADRRVPALVGIVFAAVYAVLIFLVYYAQTTAVRLDELSEEALRLLDYGRGGLLFSYDLLGYGMMALSTFFLGLTVRPERRRERWLGRLMMLHGIFFLSCFVLPMTGMFAGMADGDGGDGGTIALLFWCAYFLPIGILSYMHFAEGKRV